MPFTQVGVFLALTGFVIVLNYAGQIQTGRFAYGRYLLRRFARIYPLYFFVLTFMVMALGRPVSVVPTSAFAIAANYTMIQGLFTDLALSGTQTGWTLTVDWVFYFFAPMLLARFLKRRLSVLIVICAAIIAADLVAAWLISSAPNIDGTGPIGESLQFQFRYTIFGHLPSFLFGMLAALAFLRSPRGADTASAAQRLITGALLVAVAAGLINTALGYDVEPLKRWLLSLVGVSAMCVLLLGLARDPGRRHLVTRVLSSRLVEFVGRLSFALYLIQVTEIPQYIYWVLLGGIPAGPIRAVVLLVPVLLICAALHFLIEQPARQIVAHLFERRRARPANSAV